MNDDQADGPATCPARVPFWTPVPISDFAAAALVAREADLKSSQQILGHFSRMGVQMWGSRADQVYQTVTKFSKPQLERAMVLIYKADKSLRDARPDDRTVMEQFITQLVL